MLHLGHTTTATQTDGTAAPTPPAAAGLRAMTGVAVASGATSGAALQFGPPPPAARVHLHRNSGLFFQASEHEQPPDAAPAVRADLKPGVAVPRAPEAQRAGSLGPPPAPALSMLGPQAAAPPRRSAGVAATQHGAQYTWQPSRSATLAESTRGSEQVSGAACAPAPRFVPAGTLCGPRAQPQRPSGPPLSVAQATAAQRNAVNSWGCSSQAGAAGAYEQRHGVGEPGAPSAPALFGPGVALGANAGATGLPAAAAMKDESTTAGAMAHALECNASGPTPAPDGASTTADAQVHTADVVRAAGVDPDHADSQVHSALGAAPAHAQLSGLEKAQSASEVTAPTHVECQTAVDVAVHAEAPKRQRLDLNAWASALCG